MQRIKMAATMIVASIVLAGCANNQNLNELPFDHAQSGNVHVIGLLDPATPPRASTPIPGGSGGGLLGLVVEGTKAVMRGNREDALDQIAKANGFDFKASLVGALTATLAQEGYATKVVPVTREGTQLVKPETLPPGQQAQVDAYLDVSVQNYGYVAASPSDDAPYRPFVFAQVRLLSADGKATVLMKDLVVYNPYNNPKDVVSISPDPTFNFVNFSDIEASPRQAVTGMSVAANQTGTAIGRLLR